MIDGNINNLNNLTREVTLAGKTYKVSELTFRDISTLQNWITAKAPNPLNTIKATLDGFPVELQKILLLEAYRESKSFPPKFGSPEANRLLQTSEGLCEMVKVLLGKHQVVTEDEVRRIVENASPDDFAALMSVADNRTPKQEIEAMANGQKKV